MSLRALWAFLAVALPVLGALVASLPSTDLTYHLRAGAEILETGRIPSADSWTFTVAGEPWFDQQWGSQVLLAAVYQAVGWTGLAVLRAALVGVIFGLLFETCRRRGIGVRSAAMLALAAFIVSAVALALRPQLIGMALFALTLLLVMDRRAHPRRVWAIPVIVLVWANVHGSFFLAPAVLGLAWLADLAEGRDRRYELVAVALVCVVTACITPFGPAVWAYAVGLSLDPAVTQRVTEWQPTSLRDVPGLLFFGSVLLVVGLIARLGRPVPWPTLLWLAFFFVIGAYAVRGVAWWPLGAAVAVATLLPVPNVAAATAPERRTLRRLNGAIAVLLVIVAVGLLPVWRPMDDGLRAPAGVVGLAPPGITAELRRTATGDDRLFAPQPWGSWFEFALPEVPVALDSRIELFPASVWDDYVAVLDGAPGWERALETWRVTIVVAAGEGESDLGDRLAALGWRATFTDEDGTIYVRPSS
jgi:hypothetical protein